MSGEPTEALQRVFAAQSPDELNAAYAGWAARYDAETAKGGYCLPFVIAAWVARYVPDLDSAILDAGCGTGLSGQTLKALGYRAIDGLDFSKEMLSLAKGRNAYRSLVRGTLGETLDLPDVAYAAVFSTGVFTEGHAPASSLDELARIVRPGGHIIATVRTSVLEAKGFRQAFDRMILSGGWTMVEESPPFRAFVVAEPEVMVQAFVLRKS